MFNILFLSPADWHGPRGRFQHIAEHLSRHNRVTYFDGLGVRPIGLRDWRRVIDKLTHALSAKPAAASTPQAALPNGMGHVSPLAIPIQGNPLFSAINQKVLDRTVRQTLAEMGEGQPLIWISYPHPELVRLLDRFPGVPVIYDCVDHWSEFKGAFDNLADAEITLLKRADIVFATAELLQERVARYNSRCYLVPNGVDVEGYAAALASATQPPDDITCIPGPRIGFIGNIAHWVEFDWIERMLAQRPEWHFVFVGPWQLPSPPPVAPNFHWLGARNYATIPHYISAFDVSLIPFKDNDLTRAVDPLKLYEYLAVGQPVVSTPLPRALPFAPFVEFADTETGFQEAIARALADRSPERTQDRQRSIVPYSWTERVRALCAHIETDLGLVLQPHSSARNPT